MEAQMITERMLQIAGINVSEGLPPAGIQGLAKSLNLEYTEVGDLIEIYTETPRVAWVSIERAGSKMKVTEYDGNARERKSYETNDINELKFRLKGILNGK